MYRNRSSTSIGYIHVGKKETSERVAPKKDSAVKETDAKELQPNERREREWKKNGSNNKRSDKCELYESSVVNPHKRKALTQIIALIVVCTAKVRQKYIVSLLPPIGSRALYLHRHTDTDSTEQTYRWGYMFALAAAHTQCIQKSIRIVGRDDCTASQYCIWCLKPLINFKRTKF